MSIMFNKKGEEEVEEGEVGEEGEWRRQREGKGKNCNHIRNTLIIVSTEYLYPSSTEVMKILKLLLRGTRTSSMLEISEQKVEWPGTFSREKPEVTRVLDSTHLSGKAP